MSDADAQQSAQKVLLNVGCGRRDNALLPPWFPAPAWREIRLDADPSVEPDVVCACTDMRGQVADASIDAVFAANAIEHLHPHEADAALGEFSRVVRPDGIVLIVVPNIQKAAEMIADDRLDEPAYTSDGVTITPADMLWGQRSEIARGRSNLAHRTGFTPTTLRRALIAVGLPYGEIKQVNWDLLALATKRNFGEIKLGTSP